MKRFFSRLDYGTKQALLLVGVNGGFWFAWAFGYYQSIYLQEIGFTASELGLVNALSSAVAIAAVSFWGTVSDKIGSLKKVLIIILAVASVLYAILPILPTAPIILLSFIPTMNFFRTPTSTFADNILVRNCNEIGLNFGVLRSMGSLLFTVGAVIISLLLPIVGVSNTFWLSGVLTVPVIIFTAFVREPSASTAHKKDEKPAKLNPAELFHNKDYVIFLVFIFLFYIAANCESTFVPYFMTDIGVSSESYGIIFAYRALLEIPFLILMSKLRRRFPLRNLVVVAALLMGFECLGFGLMANSLPTMLLFCTFFGLGNGLFIGSSLNYVYELAPAHLKATAQAFYASVSSVAGILGNLIGGVVFDAIGAKPFYLVITAMYVLSVVIFLLSFIRKKNTATVADNTIQ